MGRTLLVRDVADLGESHCKHGDIKGGSGGKATGPVGIGGRNLESVGQNWVENSVFYLVLWEWRISKGSGRKSNIHRGVSWPVYPQCRRLEDRQVLKIHGVSVRLFTH